MPCYRSNAREHIYSGATQVTSGNQQVTFQVTFPISETHAFAWFFEGSVAKLPKLPDFRAKLTDTNTHTNTHTTQKYPLKTGNLGNFLILADFAGKIGDFRLPEKLPVGYLKLPTTLAKPRQDALANKTVTIYN